MSVFRNRERLSPNYPIEQYWTNIPHRDTQIKILWDFYGDILDKKGVSFFTIEVEDYKQLEDIMGAIKKVKNVLIVERM